MFQFQLGLMFSILELQEDQQKQIHENIYEIEQGERRNHFQILLVDQCIDGSAGTGCHGEKKGFAFEGLEGIQKLGEFKRGEVYHIGTGDGDQDAEKAQKGYLFLQYGQGENQYE